MHIYSVVWIAYIVYIYLVYMYNIRFINIVRGSKQVCLFGYDQPT